MNLNDPDTMLRFFLATDPGDKRAWAIGESGKVWLWLQSWCAPIYTQEQLLADLEHNLLKEITPSHFNDTYRLPRTQ